MYICTRGVGNLCAWPCGEERSKKVQDYAAARTCEIVTRCWRTVFRFFRRRERCGMLYAGSIFLFFQVSCRNYVLLENLAFWGMRCFSIWLATKANDGAVPTFCSSYTLVRSRVYIYIYTAARMIFNLDLYYTVAQENAIRRGIVFSVRMRALPLSRRFYIYIRADVAKLFFSTLLN